jgi:uncharacterized Zn finger protein (UPF0148 family)
MSDFDKEAEREKLREKYEQDQEKREATEQMSELLLQGATMTNAHCSDCGDPIFRYDGQEFCPTCEKAVEREDAGDGSQQGVEVTETSDTPVAFGGADGQQETPDETTPETGQADQQAQSPQPADQQSQSPPQDQSQHRQQAHDATANAHAGDQRRQPRAGATPAGGQRRQPAPEGGIPAAREALTETLVRFSERAAASEDPRRAKDNLEAAREAAAALRELDR